MALNTIFNYTNISSISENNSVFDRMDTCIEYLNIKKETLSEIIIKLTVYAVAFVLAIVGNSLVLGIVVRKSNFKTTTNFFIANLAFSDVLLAVVCMPATMFSIASKNIGQSVLKGFTGELICKMLPFLQGLSVAVSILTMLTLAADRFLAIVFPFQKIITKQRARMLITIIWVAGVVFNAPMLYAMKLSEHGGVTFCTENWAPFFDSVKASKDYTILLFLSLYAIPLVLVTGFYSALLRELWRGKHLHHNKTVACKENKAVLRMIVTVIVTFAVCWLPVHVTVFTVLFTKDKLMQMCGLKPFIIFIGWFMGHMNSAVNPIIYLIYNDNFRTEIFKLFRQMARRLLRRKPKVIQERPSQLRTRVTYFSGKTFSLYNALKRNSTPLEESA